jgi:hypothetical protein
MCEAAATVDIWQSTGEVGRLQCRAAAIDYAVNGHGMASHANGILGCSCYGYSTSSHVRI